MTMDDVLAAAIAALQTRLGPRGFDGAACFRITEAGSVIVDQAGARVGEGPAQVTLSADLATFRALLGGDLGAMAAYMSGRLKIEGEMAVALRLGAALA